MEAGARSEPQERIAVAYEVYARTPRSVGPKISAAAQAAGVPRSRIYEFWSSAAHLGEDLAVFRATPETSWQAQVMAASDTDVFDAIRSAVQSPTAAAGVCPASISDCTHASMLASCSRACSMLTMPYTPKGLSIIG